MKKDLQLSKQKFINIIDLYKEYEWDYIIPLSSIQKNLLYGWERYFVFVVSKITRETVKFTYGVSSRIDFNGRYY